MRWFFTLFKIFVYIPARILFPFKVIGKQRIPRGKKTYVSVTNHLSLRDVITLGLYLPGFRFFLAKKELSKNKLVGFFLKMMGAIYIDRKNMDFRAIKNCIEGLKKAPLSIFPEGTRNKDSDDIQQVKGGAAMIAVKADVDIVPVMIHHRSKLFRRNYMLIGESVQMPFSSKDRFNAEAMSTCTEIISEKMMDEKQLLDTLVTEKTWKQYKKEIKQRHKRVKKCQLAEEIKTDADSE